MATPHHSPTPEAAQIEDWVTYEEALALLARTGHRVPDSTLRRYVRQDQLPTRRVGAKDKVLVLWSDVLESHRRRTAAKLRSAARRS